MLHSIAFKWKLDDITDLLHIIFIDFSLQIRNVSIIANNFTRSVNKM